MKTIKKTMMFMLAAAMMLGLAISFAACGGDDEGTVIYIGTTGTTRPHTFREAGVLTGYDIDAIRMVVSRFPDGENIELRFVEGPIAELQEKLRTGMIDMMVNNLARTAGREAEFLFTDRGYLFQQYYVVVHTDETRTRLEEFEGGTAGGLGAGNYFHDQLLLFHYDNDEFFGEILIYETYTELFMDMDLGRVEVTLANRTFTVGHAQAANLSIQYVGEPRNPNYVYFMFANTDFGAELRDKTNVALDELYADGSMRELSIRWFGQDYSSRG